MAYRIGVCVCVCVLWSPRKEGAAAGRFKDRGPQWHEAMKDEGVLRYLLQVG